MSSTRTLVTLLRPWIRRLTIITSAWWLRTSSKFTWEEVKTSTGKLGKWSTPKRVRICPKYSARSLSRDRRIKMHQSINHFQIFHQKILLVKFVDIDFFQTIFFVNRECYLVNNAPTSILEISKFAFPRPL